MSAGAVVSSRARSFRRSLDLFESVGEVKTWWFCERQKEEPRK
jgi:hypothetical protein